MSGDRVRTQDELRDILSQFHVYGEILGGGLFGSGHINETFAMETQLGRRPMRYVLQRINHHVFLNPPAVQHNIEQVTDHIRASLRAEGLDDISGRVLTLIPTRCGQTWHQDANGDYWRACALIEGARTFDTLESPAQAFEVARCFGEFQLRLATLGAEGLHDTIPNFHNGPMRFAAFQKALAADAHNRAAQARPEIEFLEKHAWIFDVLPKEVNDGRIPLRITHNDTKCNNVMIDDATGKGICVIDLDTVMPGLALYDFGDMVRTATCTGAEDETDLKRIGMDIRLFEALVNGYMSAAGGFLNAAERQHLVFSGKLITLMIGTRFLTDFLDGDHYFRIHRPLHNLDRCRTQFKLVQSIVAQEDAMEQLVAKAG